MKKITLFLLVTTACAVDPPTGTAAQTAVDQMYWMLGSDPTVPNAWHCSTSWHATTIPGMTVEHTADAVYTFAMDAADSTLVRATYVEAAAHDNPTPVSTVETWRLTSAPFSGALSLALGINGGSFVQNGTGFNLAGGLDVGTSNNGFDTRGGITRAWQFSVRTHPELGTWLGFLSIKTGAPGLTRYADMTCRRDVETQ